MTRSFFCLDVDGVMTDGSFLYDAQGKSHKQFGPDDSDAISILSAHADVHFVTADLRGLPITRARIERDMGFPLTLVSSRERLDWLSAARDLSQVIYMGDSFVDAPILRAVGLGIAPGSASALAKSAAQYVTQARAGDRAVAEACMFVAARLGIAVPEFEGFRGA